MDIVRSLHTATSGRKTVSNSWVSPTALRPLICDDPCLVWLTHHGEEHGFTKDPDEYSLLGWLGDQGTRFEEEWLKRVGGQNVVYANQHDHDVRHVSAVLRTVEAVMRKAPVISKAALWWAPDGLYGTADILARVSWLRERLPATRPWLSDEDPDTYVVLDCKMQSRLDAPDKRLDLALASRQVRLYSHIVGNLFAGEKGRSLSRYAFVVSRDRVLDPIPVEVGEPLDEETLQLLELYKRIRDEGADLRPWCDSTIAPNPWNKKNAPWSEAVKTILDERMPSRSLHVLPYVGKRQAEALRSVGLTSLDDLLAAPYRLRHARVPGFGSKTLARAEAILAANRSDRRQNRVAFPRAVVPTPATIELFVDFEFRNGGMKVEYDRWPDLGGRDMCFMIGVGYEEEGKWRFRRFTAHEDSLGAERMMWAEFITFLRERGVIYGSVQEATICPDSSAALYHWSHAEVNQSRSAARRVGFEVLGKLPWVDLQKSFHEGPITLPGQFDFKLKSVSKALGKLSPEHGVNYPDNLQVGSDAMVMALRAYERGDALSSSEIMLIAEYLETDCKSLWQVLRWQRTSVCDSEDEDNLPRAVQGRSTISARPFHWYKLARQPVSAAWSGCN
jgi:hypothetical protein